jgi:hypothetical protein
MKHLITKPIKVKKYKWLTIFNSTTCDLKISKKKELRLREIIKQIKNLAKEMNELFKR